MGRSKNHIRAALGLLAALVAVLGSILPATTTANAAKPSLQCRDAQDAAVPLTIQVEAEKATGRYSAPFKKPTTLVVINHGYSYDSYAWQWIMKDMAREHGVLVVAMDYRGTVSPGDFSGDGTPDYHDRPGTRFHGSPMARGWAIAAGAADTNAVTQLAKKTCPTIKNTVLFSVSMGVGAGGIALADSEGLYDYWFAIEGVTNLVEEYHGACLLANSGNSFARNACEDMREETNGGDPAELAKRTLITRAQEIAASGIDGAVFVNALEDGMAPYDQGRQLQVAMRAAGVPTDFFSVARPDAKSEPGTTITSYAGATSGMAGHATEVSDTHIVMRTAYDRLWALVEKEESPGPAREFLVDQGNIYPTP
jgi:pimeloyl-ACP methyl ester carboxylesterase